MKKFLTTLCICALLVCCVPNAFAAGGKAIYSGDAGQFIFTPGSEYSPTDLFPNFKDVMPGDSIYQPITVRNDASNRVKVKIYMRALGAHEDSEAFLSMLRLQVEKSENNAMAHMFDAAASESAQLTDWVCLGTLYSGGEVNLHVILHVPTELDNQYQQQVGYLDWEFMVEEYEIEPTDPEAPDTGDSAPVWLWAAAGGMSLFVLLFLVGKRRKEEE